MIPSNWKLSLYQAEMPMWCGYFDDENGNCVGFLARDGKLVSFDANTGTITPLN